MKVLTLDDYNKKFKVEPTKADEEVINDNTQQTEVIEKDD